MAIGYEDLKNVINLPGNWDLTYLSQWRTRDGITFDQIVTRLGAALTLFNRSLRTGYWAQYYRATTEPVAEYGIGTSGLMEKISEYTRPDPIRGDTTGHMLPLNDFGRSLGWTYLAMRRARAGKLEEDIRALIQMGSDTFEQQLLQRLFKSTYDAVGNTGRSVPFADAGVADSTYIPGSYGGTNFAASHTHFFRQADDATGRSASLVAMAATLLEHGLMSPWELVIPEADIADWAAQTEFKKPERGVLTTSNIEVRALVEEETYLGILEVPRGYFRVRSSPRVPANYAGAFKVYGHGDARSPLAVRYEDGYPLGLALVGEFREFPLQEAITYFTFGVGVNNRVAGAATYYAAAGSYTSPTIS
jgi:hypothetical protein